MGTQYEHDMNLKLEHKLYDRDLIMTTLGT
jgi:hypothetical protein